MDDSLDPDDDQTTISYRAVGLGLPVVTHSGKQFGVVEHVLEVPELDLFDGIVVYTGSGFVSANMRHEKLARFEMLRIGQLRGWLRFVDADQVSAITPGYVKCSFEMDQVANLPVPNGPPVLHPDMAQEDRVNSAMRNPFTGYYGQWFRRAHWLRK
jgi:hypothetical protein